MSMAEVTVSLGTFSTSFLPEPIKRSWTIYVERAHPHRIVKWTCSNGEQAELLGADRLTYWQMNREGFQTALTKLGLTPRGPGMP